MKKILPLFLLLLGFNYTSISQNVGIGTTTPLARLHVADSTVLFSGPATTPPPTTTVKLPIQGPGTRAFWFPSLGAFRVGYVDGVQWDKDSIGQISFAAGMNTKAKGTTAMAFGYNTNALGSFSTSMGSFTTASGIMSTSMGWQTIASGTRSTAMGQSTTSSGLGSTATGGSTFAIGNYSFAANEQTYAKARGSFTIGLWNDDTDNPDPNTPASTDRIFQVGNGTSSLRSNAFTVLQNGNIGLGISDPLFRLDMKGRILVRGDGNVSNSPGVVFTNIVGDTYKGMVGMASDSIMGFLASGTNGAFWGFNMDVNSGNIGINTVDPKTGLHVMNKTVLFEGGLTSNSTISSPKEGAGYRMSWDPGNGAFRAGYALNEWNKDSTGLLSFATGWRTKAKGDYSTSLGAATIASGNSATSFGNNSRATNYVATSMGYATQANGQYSTSMGNRTEANGVSSTSFGAYTKALGNDATSMGYETIASGSASVAMGVVTRSKAYGGVVIGMYNDSSDVPLPATVNPTDRLFQIGNGTETNRTNAFTVLRSGNIGVGVLDPFFILDVGARMRIRATPGLTAGAWLNNEANTISPAFIGMRADDEVGFYGQTGSPGWRFYVNTTNGNAWLQGSLTQNSDARLKKNILQLSNSLHSILQLKGYTYNWIDPQSDSTQQIGVIAQEVQKLYPQLVKENDKGVLSVNYTGLIPVLLEGMKEQQQQIEDLKKLVLELAEKIK